MGMWRLLKMKTNNSYYKSLESFEYLWQTKLSGIRPEETEDMEEFAKRIAKLTYTALVGEE